MVLCKQKQSWSQTVISELFKIKSKSLYIDPVNQTICKSTNFIFQVCQHYCPKSKNFPTFTLNILQNNQNPM